MRLVKTIFLLLFIDVAFAQLGDYELPDSLSRSSDAVVTNLESKIIIFNKNKVEGIVDEEIIVFTKNNTEANIINIYYDKFTKVEELSVNIIDANGKVFKKIKKKDFIDQALTDYSSAINDNRVLYYKAMHNTYPYKISIHYKTINTQTLFLPNYIFYIDDHVPLWQGKFIVINKDVSNPVFFENPMNMPFDEIRNDQEVLFTFKMNLPCKNITKSFDKQRLIISPILTNFQMDNYQGSKSTWKDFGNWVHMLNSQAGKLDIVAKREIASLVDDEDSDRIKIEKLYKYLQETMRYVSIQLGIGGFKPMDAMAVHRNKFGDCKALSNYMKEALDAVNIKSNYVIIEAGDHPHTLDTSFVISNFNHAIIGIPLNGDTIFLECTASNNNPTGYQGKFTGNRKALWIDGESSHLVTTTHYSENDNQLQNRIAIDLNVKVPPIINMTQTMCGISIENNGFYFHKDDNEIEFKKFLQSSIIKGANDVIVEEYKQIKDNSKPSFEWSAQFSHSGIISKSGKRYYIGLDYNGYEEEIDDLLMADDSYYILWGFNKNNLVKIIIPENCEIEKIPSNLNISEDRASYEIKFFQQDNMIEIMSVLNVKEGELNKENLLTVQSILKNMQKIENSKIVLVCENN